MLLLEFIAVLKSILAIILKIYKECNAINFAWASIYGYNILFEYLH